MSDNNAHCLRVWKYRVPAVHFDPRTPRNPYASTGRSLGLVYNRSILEFIKSLHKYLGLILRLSQHRKADKSQSCLSYEAHNNVDL